MPGMKTLALAIITLVLVSCSPAAGPAATTPSSTPAETPKPADEQAALAALDEINQAQAGYFTRNRRYALAFDELIDAFFLKAEPSVSGYEIALRPSADASRYTIVANPASGVPAARHFYSDQTGEIHVEADKNATAESPTL